MALLYDDIICPYCHGHMELSVYGDDTQWRAKFVCHKCLIHSPAYTSVNKRDAEWFAYKQAKWTEVRDG